MPLNNASLLAQATRAAEGRGPVVQVRYPNDKETRPGNCVVCDADLPVPRPRSQIYCSRRCSSRAQTLRERKSLDG